MLKTSLFTLITLFVTFSAGANTFEQPPSGLPVESGPKIVAEIEEGENQFSIDYGFGYKFFKPDNEFYQFDRIPSDNHGQIKLRFPAIKVPDKLYYWAISYEDKVFMNTEYLIEPGDDIFIKIEINSNTPNITFSGSGWEKYQCRYELEQLNKYYDSIKMELNRRVLKDSTWSYTDFNKDLKIFEECKTKGMKILKSYRNKVSAIAYEVLLADFTANDLRMVGYFWSILPVRKNTDKYIEHTISKEFNNYFKHPRYVTPKIGYYSPDYTNYLANFVSLDFRMKNNRVPDFSDIFNHAKQLFDGDELDRILYSFFALVAPNIPREAAFPLLSFEKRLMFLQEAISLTSEQELKDKLKAMTNSLIPGLQAYNFELQNRKGDTVKLSDLKGKVVVMDMWFTGCGACAMLAQSIAKDLKPKLSDMSNVVFVSISTDESKDMWLKSVEKEIYSKKEDVNLYTNGEGFEHKITKYYGLIGLPFLLLIDRNGNVVMSGRQDTLSDFLFAIEKLLRE